MDSITSDLLLSRLRWRYATKKFDATRKIPADLWQTLEEALVLAPSSYGLQLYKFFVVTDPKVRAALEPHAFGQAQIQSASHLVVLAGRTDFTAADVEALLARIVEVRGVPADSLADYKGMMMGSVANPSMPAAEYISRQVYIALGQLLTSATVLGIDTCPMEGFLPPKFDEVLGLNGTNFTTKVLCAAGYRAADDPYQHAPKVRFPKEHLIQHI